MMDMKAQANKNAAASQQAASSPSGCKSCERKGVAIYPLRVAAVPISLVNTGWRPAVPHQDTELKGGEFKYALRTLREGYVYVLLDKKDWLGYQVTPEGFLRLFNAHEMPEGGKVESLSEACRTANHDIRSSFINIDPKYKQAQVAFSSDPWSKTVLDEYKSGKRPASRFTQVEIVGGKTANIEGAGRSLALDPTLSALTKNVLEFATVSYPNIADRDGTPNGAHGFYPRQDKDKLIALGNKVAELQEQYGVVNAIVLDDAVGVVQELNIGRLILLEGANSYIEQPGVFHKHMISEAITWYLGVLKKGVIENSQPRTEATGPAIGGYGPVTISKEQVAEERFAHQYARILKSYNEPARAAFAQTFASHFSTPMKRFTAMDKDLAAWYQNTLWKKVIEQDYAPETCPSGWAWQMLTVAACLQGGALGEATDKIWHDEWLTTATSPAYLGFTGMQTSLMETLFSGGNVYGYLKTGTTSDEFANILKNAAIQRGFSSRLVALAGSMSRPGMKVSDATRKGYMAMTQGAMLTAGESTVVMTWDTTLRNLKRRLKSDAALRQNMAKNNATFEVISKELGGKSMRGGSALMVDELMGVQGEKPGIRGQLLDTPVRVQFSVPGTLEEVRAAFPQMTHAGTTSGNLAVLGELEDVFISDMSLQGKGLKDPVFRASYSQMATLNERTMRIVSGEGAGLMLGAGLMALQVGNIQSLREEWRQSVGTDVDAVSNTAITTLLFIEGMAEVSGFASKLAVKLNWVVLSKAQQVPGLVRFGGVLGGIASIVDGIRNGVHGWDANKAGDTVSTYLYGTSAVALITSGILSGVSARAGIFALLGTESFSLLGLGPAGWAVLLILAGMALAYAANEQRSTAFEIWLRRTCFGIPNGAIDSMPVWHADSLEELSEALTGIRAIAGGMVADVAFASGADILTGNPTVKGVDYRRVDFRVSMPGWVDGSGGWSVQLTGGGKTLFAKSDNAPETADHDQRSGPEGYDKYIWQRDGVIGEDGQEKGPWSLSLMVSVWVPASRTPEVTLTASYWPDIKDPENKLSMTINATQG